MTGGDGTAPRRATRRESPFAGAAAASWFALVMLIFIGLYMYSDRQVMVLQTEQLKASLGLSDFQIGLIQGLGVAMFAAVIGYPIAWLADRFESRRVLALCVLLWAAAVAVSGSASSFTMLFLASAVVGAGEAGLLPITYAMIPELFKDRSRLLANSMVTVVGRIGSGIVIALGGLLVQHVGSVRPWLPAGWQEVETWRLALFAIALPGPLFALVTLCLKLKADPAHRAATPVADDAPRSGSVGPFLSRHRALFFCCYLGIGLFVFGTSAFGAFLPVVAMRQMGATPASVGAGIGLATLISTILAMLAIVAGGGALQRLLGKRYPLWLLTLSSLAPAAIAPLFLLARTPLHIYLLLGLTFLFLSGGSMAFPTALQDLTPRVSRARLISITIMINIVLSAIAPAVVGAISDRLAVLPNGLMIATVATAMTALLLSAGLMLLCLPRYIPTTQAARAEEALAEPNV